MRPFPPLLALLLLLPALPAHAQADGCRGALSALNRVKEQITPQLTPDTPTGKSRLLVIKSALEDATHLCKDKPELWFYRMVVAKRLGQEKDADYARGKIDDIAYDNHYDPFTPPPSAVPAASLSQIAATKIHKKWALVVGIDDFTDDRIPHLKYAVKDSTDFVTYLEDPKGGRFDPSHVQHLTNDKATLEAIREAIGNLRANAKPDDLVVLYFSGHGSPRDIDPNGVSYILTHDTDLENSATLYASSLQMIDLVQLVNREIKAHNVVLFLDTCYSGDALTSSTDSGGSRGAIAAPAAAPAQQFSEAFQNLKLGYGRAVFTASRANERSWESASLKNGYFTHYLIESLRADPSKENLNQLYALVSSKVSKQVATDQHASQNPSFEYSEHGDSIVLGVPEAAD